MSENKRKRARNRQRPKYKYHPRAIDLTVYSSDGSPVPDKVFEELQVAVGAIALENKLLVSVLKA